MKYYLSCIWMIWAVIALAPPAAAFECEPLVMLIQSKGQVSYSPNGELWKKVRRNKFLCEGWYVRTGPDGHCKLVDRHTESMQVINPNTQISVGRGGTKTVRGEIPKTESAVSFISYLQRKFANIQKYTVVKRHLFTDDRIELETVDDIALARDYPDLVWDNVGSKYAYRLIVGDQAFGVEFRGKIG